MTKPAVSFASLNQRKAHEVAHKFKPTQPDGTPYDFTLHVLGQHSESAAKETSRLVNERRAQEAAREAGSTDQTFTPFEDDVRFGQRLAAARICGWDDLDVEYTPARAVELCQMNPDIARQALAKSNTGALFTPASPKA